MYDDKEERQRAPEIEQQLDAEEKHFAETLEQVMVEKHVKQSRLAELTGVGQPAIANMLARQCRPQRRTVKKIAQALDIDPMRLWPFKE